jgi:hypothetical protein
MLLIMVAEVEHVYQTTQGTNEKGERFGGGHKAQLRGWRYLSNGEKRADHFDLNVKDPQPFQEAVGSHIAVPVGCFAPQRNVIKYFPTNNALTDQERRVVASLVKTANGTPKV